MGQPGHQWCEELVDRRGQRLEASPGRDWRTSMDENGRAIGCGHLWAIGYDDMEGADRVRHEITGLGWDKPYLLLEDVAKQIQPTLARMSESSGHHAKAS